MRQYKSSYLSPFHHSLDTIQLVPISVEQMKIIEKEKMIPEFGPQSQ